MTRRRGILVCPEIRQGQGPTIAVTLRKLPGKPGTLGKSLIKYFHLIGGMVILLCGFPACAIVPTQPENGSGVETTTANAPDSLPEVATPAVVGESSRLQRE